MADSEKEYILEKLQEALEKAENDGCIYAKIRRPIVFDTIALLKEQEAEKKCCRDCEYYGACHDE